MNKYPTLLKLLFCVSILAGSCVLSFLPVVVADGQQANLPLRTVGDEWTFVVDYKGDPGLICNLTTTVTETSVLSPSGNHECFELTSIGNGVVYGQNVSGTWSMNIKEYYRKSDFSLAEMVLSRTVTIVGISGSTTTTEAIKTIYNPPFGINNGFPLTAGKTWSATSTIITTVSIDIDGQITQDNSTSTQSMNFAVIRIENTATAGGAFETFVLRGTTADGSIQEIYYSSKVGMQVKEIDYDAIGNIVATMGLVEYNVTGSVDTLPIYWIALAIALVGVAIIASGFIMLKRSKSKNLLQRKKREEACPSPLS